MTPDILLLLLLFILLAASLMMGFPVAFTLAGASLLVALIADALGHFDLFLLTALPQRVFSIMVNEVLLSIPLFVFMGIMLERAKIAEDLLDTMGRLFVRLPGGLAVASHYCRRPACRFNRYCWRNRCHNGVVVAPCYASLGL